jgi:NADH-quinone oxidoreductase subunit E
MIQEGTMDARAVDGIIDRYQGKRTALINILHDLQGRYHYLPQGALRRVASRLEIDLRDLYGVATFYKSFSLAPQGKHSVTVCSGTACHVRGGPKVLREAQRLLKIEPGQTTRDRQFSLNVVNCLGVCAIGPVMVVDGKIYGEMNASKVKKIIAKMGKKENGGKA